MVTSSNVVICDEQIAQYQRDGALLIRGVLGGEQLDLLERGVEEAHAAPGAVIRRCTAHRAKA